MKYPMIILAAAALTLGQATIAHAGGNKNGQGQRGQQRAQHMQEQFGVTDDQLAQMREIRQNGGSREDMRAVLSDDQREQMQQWRQDNPDKAGRGGHSRHSNSAAETE